MQIERIKNKIYEIVEQRLMLSYDGGAYREASASITVSFNSIAKILQIYANLFGVLDFFVKHTHTHTHTHTQKVTTFYN
jgi:hypothetical protein